MIDQDQLDLFEWGERVERQCWQCPMIHAPHWMHKFLLCPAYEREGGVYRSPAICTVTRPLYWARVRWCAWCGGPLYCTRDPHGHVVEARTGGTFHLMPPCWGSWRYVCNACWMHNPHVRRMAERIHDTCGLCSYYAECPHLCRPEVTSVSPMCEPWPHFCDGQVHYPSETTIQLDRREPGRTVRSLGLVPCSAKKIEGRGSRPARKLYRGRIFRAALETSERWHDATLIVSGAHGALHPDQAVPPYEYRLHGPRAVRKAWADFTAGEIAAFVAAFAPTLESITCYAGAIYAEPLREAMAGLLPGVAFFTPLRGVKGVQAQVSWLDRLAETGGRR